MALTVYDCNGLPVSRRLRIQAAVEAAGRHLSERYQAWISTDPSGAAVLVLIIGPNGFDRTVTLAIDEELGTIKERIRQTVDE